MTKSGAGARRLAPGHTLRGDPYRELVMAVRTVAVGLRQAKELDAHHEPLLALLTVDVLEISHGQLQLVGPLLG